MNRFVLGDTHGAYRALIQVLEKSGFDYDNDQLICLGDVADSWPDVPLCFEELRKIRNIVYVIGNHCAWLREYLKFGATPYIWLSQGGQATLDAYVNLLENGDGHLLDEHLKFLDNSVPYYELDNKLFVHGGFNWHHAIKDQLPYTLMWDRHLYETARYWQRLIDKGIDDGGVEAYDEVFIGHTTTTFFFPDLKPVKLANVWNLDQGCGFEGRLTLMNIDTKEYVQSDLVNELYPGIQGR